MAHAARDDPVGAGRPNMARVYDYLNGGKDNFAADRDLAERMEAEAGDGASVRDLARVNRRFVLAAARWSASMLGVAQFIDLGCGLPLVPAVHDAARDGCPEAVVVYADEDPVVFSHAAALWSGPGLAAVKADVSDPARVLEVVAGLEDPDGGKLIDLGRPAAIVLGGTLSAMTADVARSAVAAYAAALAPRSCMIISCASYADPGTGAKMAEMFGAAGQWVNHDPETVTSFFLAAGLRIVRGRVGHVKCWPLLPAETPAACVLGGVGIRD